MVFHLRSCRSSHFENLFGAKDRHREDCCAAAEVFDTILVLVAFCDLVIFGKTLVAVAFGFDTGGRGLLWIFDNNPTVDGFDSDSGDNHFAVDGWSNPPAGSTHLGWWVTH